jgi:hypothetical protein
VLKLSSSKRGNGDMVTSMVNFEAVKRPDRSPAFQAAM